MLSRSASCRVARPMRGNNVEQRPVIAAKLALAAWPREAAMDLPKREVTMNAVSRSLGSLGSLAGLHERMRISVGSRIASCMRQLA